MDTTLLPDVAEMCYKNTPSVAVVTGIAFCFPRRIPYCYCMLVHVLTFAVGTTQLKIFLQNRELSVPHVSDLGN